jgi:hypothetical protein
MEVMFGYSRQELIGQPIDSLLPERDHAVDLQQDGDSAAQTDSYPKDANREPVGLRKGFHCWQDHKPYSEEVYQQARPSSTMRQQQLTCATPVEKLRRLQQNHRDYLLTGQLRCQLTASVFLNPRIVGNFEIFDQYPMYPGAWTSHRGR